VSLALTSRLGNNARASGKNFLIRAASGVGSLAATLVGNNSNAAFSEGDLLRDRVSENIGDAGDSELISLNLTSRIVVSVPADMKICTLYITHDESQTGLHRVASQLAHVICPQCLGVRTGAFVCAC
jgi:hypothetical protein